MSRTLRKLATSLCRLDYMYIFNFDLRIKSISSCGSRVHGVFSRKFTLSASIHSTSRCRCGDHNRKWGRISLSLGMFAADGRIILAILRLVQFHFHVPSPHSISRCSRVSVSVCRCQCSTYVCGWVVCLLEWYRELLCTTSLRPS